MDAQTRRGQIAALLRSRTTPITGGALAKQMQVSRQVIVQDIALLRTAGQTIFATPEGYLMPPAVPSTAARRVIAARHLGDEALRDELETIVALGGVVVDVSIEHAIYGEFKSMLLIRNPAGVDTFIHQLRDSGMSPMSLLTGGVHLHTLEAADEQTLDAIVHALDRKGYLLHD